MSEHARSNAGEIGRSHTAPTQQLHIALGARSSEQQQQHNAQPNSEDISRIDTKGRFVRCPKWTIGPALGFFSFSDYVTKRGPGNELFVLRGRIVGPAIC